MSTFEQNWPVSEEITAHEKRVSEGLAVIRDRLILPEDNRWGIGYGVLVMGGRDNAVIVEGNPGTGKTEFGNIVIGEDYRIDVAADDRASSIEGYTNPTNSRDWIPGKANMRTADLRLYLNEAAHLGNTGPLHKWWDGTKFFIGNNAIDTSDAVLYAATNFPDGRRNKPLDDAFRSRQAMSILSGDASGDVIEKIQGRDIVRDYANGHNPETGLLPPPMMRRSIREAVVYANPNDEDTNGKFIRRFTERLNNSGLVYPISPTDNRLGRGWQQVVRAKRLVQGKAHTTGQLIKTYDLLQVAPLAVGSVALLSNQGSAALEERLGYIDRPTAHERAVFARRIVAAAAFAVHHEMQDPEYDSRGKVIDKTNELELHAHLQENSFAFTPEENTAKALTEVLHAAIVRGEDLTKEPHHERSSSRINPRRRSR